MAATPEQYNSVFKISPSGRIVLEDLMKAHFIYESSFNSDPYLTAFREGERNVVLRILTIIDTFEKEKA